MTEFSIPCETFVRLSKVLPGEDAEQGPSWNTFRYDNGCLVVTDRSFMAIEKISNVPGVAHFVADRELIDQCAKESLFNSRMIITVNEMLKFAVAKTTLGYVSTKNLLYTGAIDEAWNRWREIVLACREPAAKPIGAMFWAMEGISKLTASSPSGRVVFEECIDTSRPALIRDVTDYQWLGVFNPLSFQDHYAPAILPSWMLTK